jgi:hypothetical protein
MNLTVLIHKEICFGNLETSSIDFLPLDKSTSYEREMESGIHCHKRDTDVVHILPLDRFGAIEYKSGRKENLSG